MREIKFRAWRPTTKEMDYTATDRCDCQSMFEHKGTYNNWKIMQYTGLKDKNGKEIYEGDIVNTKEGVRRVVFTAPSFTLDPSYDDGDYYIGSFSEAWKWSEFEVIGNIYENPELLKG